ncbi:MAG: peptidoglycan binding protein CsiV [Gammaproteobacteria bacterium]|nr:peptidoglycan binding protein CsiV [Gammaproteobacteria bacterium]
MKVLTLFLVLFVFLSNQLYASNTGYEVEIIIFENLNHLYQDTENWPELLTIHNSDNYLATQTPAFTNDKQHHNKDAIFELVKNQNLRLDNLKEKLSNNSNHRVLYHSAWKQMGLDRDNAIPFEIDSRQYYTNSLQNDHINNSVPEKTINTYVEGYVTLILSRYLHFNIDLTYYIKQENISEILIMNESNIVPSRFQQYDQFKIASERRMRSQEIHYIDHPLIGILVIATPFKVTETNPKNQF